LIEAPSLGGGGVTELAQHVLEQHADHQLVFDDEDPLGRHRRLELCGRGHLSPPGLRSDSQPGGHQIVKAKLRRRRDTPGGFRPRCEVPNDWIYGVFTLLSGRTRVFGESRSGGSACPSNRLATTMSAACNSCSACAGAASAIRRCCAPWTRCRGSISSKVPSWTTPMRTRRCRSPAGRPSASLTWSPS